LPAASKIEGNRDHADADDQGDQNVVSPTPARTLSAPHYRRRNHQKFGLGLRQIIIVEPLARASKALDRAGLGSALELRGPLLTLMLGEQGFEPFKIARNCSVARVGFRLW